MSEWFSNLDKEAFIGKHVRSVGDTGTLIEGHLEVWEGKLVTVGIGGLTEGVTVLWSTGENRWYQARGIRSVDLVWDERDWEQIDAKDVHVGDAVVSNGRLYQVTNASLLHSSYPCVGTDALGRMPIDLRLVSCALRRKVKVPIKPGFYKDGLGEFWARAAKSTDDGPWWSVEPDALDQPAKSDKYMANLMPLTPVHFESGRAA